MTATHLTRIFRELDRLRAELIELAYTLDTRGRLDAADVAITTSARIGELCAEFTANEENDHEHRDCALPCR